LLSAHAEVACENEVGDREAERFARRVGKEDRALDGLRQAFDARGEAEVTRQGERLATRGPGDFVGEIALIEKIRRTATVTAKTPLRFFVLTNQSFRSLIDANPDVERKVLRTLAKRVVALSGDPTL